jgi:hypothetical protein
LGITAHRLTDVAVFDKARAVRIEKTACSEVLKYLPDKTQPQKCNRKSLKLSWHAMRAGLLGDQQMMLVSYFSQRLLQASLLGGCG